MCPSPLDVGGQDELWFDPPYETAAWLQRNVNNKEDDTTTVAVGARRGIQTPQTKNTRLDYEEWNKAASRRRRAALQRCRNLQSVEI